MEMISMHVPRASYLWRENLPEDCKPMAFDEQGRRLPTLDVFTPLKTDFGKGSRSRKAGKGCLWQDEWYGASKCPEAGTRITALMIRSRARVPRPPPTLSLSMMVLPGFRRTGSRWES